MIIQIKLLFKNIQQTNNIKIVSSKKELWWVGSINLGIQNLIDEHNLSDDDIVVFANNDIQIDEIVLTYIYKELKKDIKQIVHPRTFDQNDFEVSSGAKIISFFSLHYQTSKTL